jgi:hypothetical protein
VFLIAAVVLESGCDGARFGVVLAERKLSMGREEAKPKRPSWFKKWRRVEVVSL